ncbi:hypothetical protein ACFV0L_14480 [Streptosporangium canum]
MSKVLLSATFVRPSGYCGIGGTNVKLGDPSGWSACQTGLAVTEE